MSKGKDRYNKKLGDLKEVQKRNNTYEAGNILIEKNIEKLITYLDVDNLYLYCCEDLVIEEN